MKLISRFTISFSVILILFTTTTCIFLGLSDRIVDNTSWVVHTEEVIGNSESMEKSVLEMQSSARGFLLTGKSEYFTPYQKSKKEFKIVYENCLKLTSDNPAQNRIIKDINSLVEKWINTFAEPAILAKRKAIKNPDNSQEYDSLFNNIIMPSYGKMLIDTCKGKFDTFNQNELALKSERNTKLESSISFGSNIAIGLTIFSIVFGSLISIYLLSGVNKRLGDMVMMSEKVSGGDFDVKINDDGSDEISRVSAALNIMTKKLKKNFLELEKKNSELDQFAYVVSHDLKAPLRGIASLSEWIEEDISDQISDDTKKNMDLLRGRVHRLQGLIDGILEYSRIGRAKLQEELINLNDLIPEIISILGIPEKFQINMSKNFPQILTNRIYMEQIFSNLLSNAVKYHDKEKGTIEILYNELTDYHQFIIKDDGPGISPEYHEKIFVIFQTLNSRDKIESTGVGLAIVKKIILEQGGIIHVKSAPGSGSEFIFTWPKKKIEQ